MAEKLTLQATQRSVTGRKVKQLRAEGWIIGNVYVVGEDSVAVQMKASEAKKMLAEAGETQVVYLTVEGEKKPRPVLFDETQLDPIDQQILHVTLREVNLKEKVEAPVPVVVTGESKVPETVLVVIHDEIMVEALPTDLPKEFVVNVEGFQAAEDMVTFAQLDYDKEKVKLLVEEEELDTPLVVLQAVKEEVEEEVAVEGEGEAGENAAETSAEEGEKAE